MRWVGIKCYKPIGSTPGFAKHLLLGRFPKRKAVHPSDVDDAAVEADDEERNVVVSHQVQVVEKS